MTQKEFETQMQQFRLVESEEKAPLAEELKKLQNKKNRLMDERDALNAQIRAIKQRIGGLDAQFKEIGTRYYMKKKQWMIDHPKEEME